MTQADSPIYASSIDLIGTDHLGVQTMTAAISSCLDFQVYSFVGGIQAQSIEIRKTLTCHRDGDLGSKFNVVPCVATHD